MYRDELRLDRYDLMKLMLDFLGESGSIVIDSYYDALDNNETNQGVAKHFADYACQWFYDRAVESPLYFFSQFKALDTESVRWVTADSQARQAILPTIDELRRKQELLDFFVSHVGDLISRANRLQVQGFIDECLAIHADAQRQVEISKAIEAHYRERRAESLAVISSPKLRTLIMERDGAKCRWCGDTEGLALDHVMPVSAGGTDDPDNLQLLCGSCNSSKGDRVPSESREA